MTANSTINTQGAIKNCANCIYWKVDKASLKKHPEDREGTCRRYPPVFNPVFNPLHFHNASEIGAIDDDSWTIAGNSKSNHPPVEFRKGMWLADFSGRKWCAGPPEDFKVINESGESIARLTESKQNKAES